MKVQALLLASLAALGTSSVVPEDSSIFYPHICKKATGVYDTCDSQHSYFRCNGHNALLVVDCRVGNNTYCRIVNGRGSCDGTTPPDLSFGSNNNEATSYAAAPSI
ncbi:hypothetical protein F5Y14DRAFT_453700 [Nemania sp. NC0429]|nr:hypothetical protein F5Y14DRAFT_453700 [Nemania sp. NC0429]